MVRHTVSSSLATPIFDKARSSGSAQTSGTDHLLIVKAKARGSKWRLSFSNVEVWMVNRSNRSDEIVDSFQRETRAGFATSGFIYRDELLRVKI